MIFAGLIHDTEFQDVPKDARTILKSERKIAILNNEFIHFRLRHQILSKLGAGFRHRERHVDLHV